MSMMQRALVLGAGGHAASAWEIGLITGLAESGVDVRHADLFVGTSAGARVAVQITSGVSLEELFQRQIDPRRQQTEAPAGVDWKSLRVGFARAREGGGGEKEVLRSFGTLALTGAKGAATTRKQFIEGQLPVHTWPEQKLRIATVEAETGERHVFDQASGIHLVDAVMASGAVAGMWPAVEFAGRHYFDGGFYSTDNADLATGCSRVLIAALRAGSPPLAVRSLADAVEQLRVSGARVEVVHPDETTEAAYAAAGGNLLDPAVCEPAARAGRAQAALIAGQIAVLWQ